MLRESLLLAGRDESEDAELPCCCTSCGEADPGVVPGFGVVVEGLLPILTQVHEGSEIAGLLREREGRKRASLEPGSPIVGEPGLLRTL